MSKRIVWDDPARVLDFVTPRVDAERFSDEARAIGLENDGELIAGVVFEGKNGTNILMHVASDGSRHWMTPAYMAACFRYAFVQEGCTRITGLVRADMQQPGARFQQDRSHSSPGLFAAPRLEF